jgi:hypothetical protein
MKKVLLWFENHISELNNSLAFAHSSEKEEIQNELKTAIDMKRIVLKSIPTIEEWEKDEDEENDEFCDQCDWHGGSCQAHPKEG